MSTVNGGPLGSTIYSNAQKVFITVWFNYLNTREVCIAVWLSYSNTPKVCSAV